MKYLYAILIFCIFMTSCGKNYLEIRPDKALLVPTTLADFQALMDNVNTMNIIPGLQVIANGDYSIDPVFQQNLTARELNSYFWKDNTYLGYQLDDWNLPYKQVFIANVVLDGLAKLPVTDVNRSEWSNSKGSALFYRAFAFFNLSQLFTQPYHLATAGSFPGIPIRIEADVNIKKGRGTLQQTYDQITTDLIAAEELMSEQVSVKSRPGKAAARALLARVYLSQGNYVKAGFYAGLCLKLNDQLINYNEMDINEVYPFPDPLEKNNVEVIFSYDLLSYRFFSRGFIKVVDELYNAYDQYDLRKALFYYEDGNRGVYFTGYKGLCTDEMYLIKAECLARQKDKDGALLALNTLLSHRWAKDKFSSYQASNSEDALKIILIERRKELVGRELRWTDLRRLNQDPLFAVPLIRTSGSVNYTLQPEGKNYTFLIPGDEITLNGIVQNER